MDTEENKDTSQENDENPKEQKYRELERNPDSESEENRDTSGFLAKVTKRQIIVGVALLVVIVLLGVVGFVIMNNNSNENLAAENTTQEATDHQLAAAIALVEGNVQYSTDGGETWADAEGGETVQESDYVRTLKDSRGVVLLDDGSAIRLAPDTTIYLAESSDGNVTVTLESGQVYSRVVEDAAREFSVSTPKESFVAQGTAYRVSTSDDSDKLEVYQSKVEVATDKTVVEEGNSYDTKSKQASELDLKKLAKDEFIQWNKDQDKKSDEFKSKLGVLEVKPEKEEEEEPEEPTQPAPSASISLNANAKDSGIAFSWSVLNTSAPNGFKLVRSKSSSTPTFGKHTSVYLSKSSQRSYTLGLKDGNTYNFRLCIYRPSTSSCDTYSNSVTVKAPYKPPETVKAGDVTLSIENKNISWTFTGTAPHGFKVLLSTSQNPTYPANSIKYTNETSAKLPDKPVGTYYVRVCKYTADSQIDGGCTDYSNQVEYVVSD